MPSPASHFKNNNVGQIDIPFYLNSDSRLICTHKKDQIVLVNYNYLFGSVSYS